MTAPQTEALETRDGDATQRQQAETRPSAVTCGCESSSSTASLYLGPN